MELRKASLKYAIENSLLFRDVKDHEGIYKVSYNGLVYSFISDKILKPGLSNGYYSVVLWNGKEKKTNTIHTIVAKAWLPNPSNKKCVNHIFGNKENNHKDLLEWSTHKENNFHAVVTGLRNLKCTPEMIKSIRLEYIRADKNFGAVGLAKKYNLNKCTIVEIIKNKNYNDVYYN